MSQPNRVAQATNSIVDVGTMGQNLVELEQQTVDEISELVMKSDVIELFESLSGDLNKPLSAEQRRKILNAATKVTSEDAERLRSQIEIHARWQTPIDKTIYEAAKFAITILDLRDSRRTA